MFRAVSSLECQKHLRCITRIDRAKDCIYNLFSFANVSISDVYSSKKKKNLFKRISSDSPRVHKGCQNIFFTLFMKLSVLKQVWQTE